MDMNGAMALVLIHTVISDSYAMALVLIHTDISDSYISFRQAMRCTARWPEPMLLLSSIGYFKIFSLF